MIYINNILNMISQFYKHLPLLNFIVASSALTFQVTVLYPWHEQISHQLDKQLLQEKLQRKQKKNN
jgi:hypothetical protein